MKNKRSETNEVKDTSPVVPQRNKIKNQLSIHERTLNEKQKQFLELAMDKNTKIIFVSGPAGTSKTYMTVYTALTLLNQHRVSDLIYVRSAVECADSKIGFLPGLIEDKMQPYIQPLIDKLEELLPKNEIEILKKEERITGMPVSFLRGLNFNAKVLILDEAQNCTFKEIFTFITRTGEFSKVFVIGDPEQNDLNGKSGFIKIISHFDDEESKSNGVYVFRFTENDIVRSGLVKFLVNKIRKTI